MRFVHNVFPEIYYKMTLAFNGNNCGDNGNICEFWKICGTDICAFKICEYKRGSHRGFYHKDCFVFKMERCFLICLLLGISVRVNNISTEETSSSVLFTSIGQATLQTAYGHLLVPLNIPALKEAFDHFADLQSAVNKLIASNTDAYNHRQSELKTLRGKLDIIHHLALTKKKRILIFLGLMISMTLKIKSLQIWVLMQTPGRQKPILPQQHPSWQDEERDRQVWWLKDWSSWQGLLYQFSIGRN